MSSRTDNYFQLFGIPVSFDVDLELLSQRYRNLQREYHPDRFASAPEQKQRLAVQMSARINDAWQTLKDPLSRGRYLLSLQGVEVDMDKNTAMDPAFLMVQMEYRERLDEAGDMEALMSLGDELLIVARDCIERLSVCFGKGDRQALAAAAEQVRELQFVNRLQEEIARKEEQYL